MRCNSLLPSESSDKLTCQCQLERHHSGYHIYTVLDDQGDEYKTYFWESSVPEDVVGYTCTLIKADVPTKKGNIYPKEMLLSAIEHYKKERQFGCLCTNLTTLAETIDPDVSKFSHEIVDVELVDEYISCGVRILDTENGRLLSKLIENDSVEICPKIYGIMGSPNTVTMGYISSMNMKIKED